MGTIQTIRPNGNAYGAGGFVNTGGGSLYGALSDSSDATYVKKDAVSGGRLLAENLGTYTVGASARVKRLRAGLRVAAPSGCKYALTWRIGIGYSTKVWTANYGSPTTKYTQWVDLTVEQADVDVATVEITEYKDSAERTTFYEAFLELDIIDRPTVTVTTPVTTTLRPDVAWTYADGDGDPQTHYEVKIFTAAVYGGGGFSADTSTPAWESGETASAAATVRVATSLANSTTHKAYVRVGHDGGSAYGTYWSAWTASAAFATSITACTTPTMTGIYSEPDGRVELSIVGAAPPGGTTQTLRVERSTDSGVTWTAVRDYTSATFGSPYTPTVYDYEAPLGVTSQYRARAVGVNAGGDDVSSPWSAINSETPWVTGWWLKCPLDSSLNLGDVWVLEGPEISVEETIGVFRPIGRDRAVTVAGDLYGEDGSWQIRAGNTDDYQTIDTIAALMTTQNVLYVQDPFGGNRYVRLTSRSRTVEGTAEFPRTVWSVTYVEVDAPAVE